VHRRCHGVEGLRSALALVVKFSINNLLSGAEADKTAAIVCRQRSLELHCRAYIHPEVLLLVPFIMASAARSVVVHHSCIRLTK